MKKKRTIIIKNSHLKIIRANLRDLIHNAVIKKIDNFKLNGLYAEANKLFQKKKESICQCFVCGNGKRDMTYNPSIKAWFCNKCFQTSRDFYFKMMQKKSAGENLGDFDEQYYATFI